MRLLIHNDINLYLTLAIISFFFQLGNAQTYQQLKFDRHELTDAFVLRLDALQANLVDHLQDNYSGRERKMMVKRFTEYNDFYREQVLEGVYVYHEDYVNYLQAVVDKIREENHSLIRSDILITLSRDPSLNAFCLPNGLLVVNMGLFHYLENEQQLASVIAHEIAHNLLRHGEKSIYRSVQKINSKEFEKKIKQAKRAEYNQSKKALQVIREDLYDTGRMRRENELQADSLGFVLINNSVFNETEFLQALELMHHFDTIEFTGVQYATYAKYFDLPNLPFDSTWMEPEDFSGYNYRDNEKMINEDSVRTHPEVETRIEQLQLISNSKGLIDSQNKETDSQFLDLSRCAEFEQIPSMNDMEEYGKALYTCLYRLQQEKDNKYYQAWMGKLFASIRDARKSYTMNRYVERVKIKNQSASYQQFLTFIWNLEYNEIETIAAFYSDKR